MLNNIGTGTLPEKFDKSLSFVGKYTVSDSILTIPNINLDKYNYLIIFYCEAPSETDIILGFRDLSTWTTTLSSGNTVNYGGIYITWAKANSSIVYLSRDNDIGYTFAISTSAGLYAVTPKTGSSLVLHTRRDYLGSLSAGEAFVYKSKKTT